MGLSTAAARLRVGADRAVRRWTAPAVRLLPALAVASLVANIVVIGTGGAVRLTASGLGCPTWPRCGDGSYVTQPQLGVHGAIEFGNRLLTFVLTVVVLVTLVAAVAARRHRPGTVPAAALLLGGIPVQAVVGGVSVLTHLNPWVVTLHFTISAALVAVAAVLVRRTRADRTPGRHRWGVPRAVGMLSVGILALVALVVYAGTVVTGSGPHAGASGARRTGLDPASLAQLHADLVLLLIGLTAGLAVALLAAGPGRRPAGALRAAWWLLGVEAGQALVGGIQYATGLPVALVDLHLVGSGCVILAAVWALTALRVPDLRRVASVRLRTRPEQRVRVG